MTRDGGADQLVGRLKLLAIVALFFGPLVVAALWYGLFPQYAPDSRSNHGHLLDPARPLPAVDLPGYQRPAIDGDYFHGKWTLLYVGDGNCEDLCQRRLYYTRQIRTATGRHRHRVQRLYLIAERNAVPSRLLREAHPQLAIGFLPEDAKPLRRTLTANGKEPVGADRVFIIDPLGNVVMYYEPDAAADGMLDDLKHLLRLSRVG